MGVNGKGISWQNDFERTTIAFLQENAKPKSVPLTSISVDSNILTNV